jgi:hypothetical protein
VLPAGRTAPRSARRNEQRNRLLKDLFAVIPGSLLRPRPRVTSHNLRALHWLDMNDLIATFAQRGDLAHLALLLWAGSASALAWFALRELAASMRRFDDFVRELARFNDAFRNHAGDK